MQGIGGERQTRILIIVKSDSSIFAPKKNQPNGKVVI